MENTIENAEAFLRQLQKELGIPMNSTTELFWSETLYKYGKELEQSRQAGTLPLPGQNEIVKAADKFLVENSAIPHIDHWSFRMGARWGINEVLTCGNDR